MKKINLLSCILLMPLLIYAQAQDEFIFENGDDNVVFVETIELDQFVCTPVFLKLRRPSGSWLSGSPPGCP